MASMFSVRARVFLAAAALGLAAGCLAPPESPEARASQARYQFQEIVRRYHVPAGDTTNEVERVALLLAARQGYEGLLAAYPEQRLWAAQSVRAVAQIHLVEGRPDEALAWFDRVGRDYPEQDWEVIQAWKSAGDHLRDRGEGRRAAAYFRRIVTTYDKPGVAPMFQTMVTISKRRLDELSEP